MISRFFLLACLAFFVVLAAAPTHAIESSGERIARKAKEATEGIPQGDAALADKNWDLAISRYTRVIDAKAVSGITLGQVYFKRGLAFQGKNDCVNAVIDYDLAAEILTDNAEVVYNRYLCHDALGQPDKAMADLDTAIKINPDSAIYRVARCITLFNRKNFVGAIPDCEMALRVAPEDQQMLLALSQAYEQTGDQAKALDAYRRLLKLDPGNSTARDGVKRLAG